MTAKPRWGDFRLTHVSSTTGTLIRIAQILNGSGFGDYEHAQVYVGPSYIHLGTGWFVEAELNGARKARYPLNEGYWSSGCFPLTWHQRTDICNAAESYVGVGYSLADYLALALHRFAVPFPELKQYIATSGHMICSQLVDQCYLDAGVHLFDDGRWPGYVTPGDLYLLLESKSPATT